MPRKPAVPRQHMEDAIVLAKEEICDETGVILGPTAAVWQHLASNLNNILTPRYLYQYVKQNRNNIHSILGLSEPYSTASPIYSCSLASSVSDISMDYTGEAVDELQPEKTFIITFTPEEWCTIRPVESVYKRKDRRGLRLRMVLPPRCWADKVIDKLWEGHKLPCPYTIKRSIVTSGEDTEYIKIAGYCKECGATATGVIYTKPVEGESVSLSWRATDTRQVPHQKSRWLQGLTRLTAGKELKRNCASAYRREMAFFKMDQGDLKPPTLWPLSVLRKAKQEVKERDLGTTGHESPVTNLVTLKHSSRYSGIIHDVGYDKFFVHYYSPAQILLYKKHRRTNYTKLSIDATGGLVKKVRHHSEHSSGHIFLYAAIMSSKNKDGTQVTLPVCQMLSEKHDTNSISYWLFEWRRAGAPVPHEIVVDNSNALKNAVARVFAGVSMKCYLVSCFRYVRQETGLLPKVFIRLDVAHYVHAACRWAVWADKSQKRIKDFYVRCLGLLINAQSFAVFESRLKHTLTVALSPSTTDCDGNATAKTSISLLSKEMVSAGIEVFVEESVPEKSRPTNDTDVESSDSTITQWIIDLKTSILNEIDRTDDPLGELNPYYLPEVAREFCRIAAEFTLWSGVLVSGFGSPFIRGTSSPVESAFADLKCNILKGDSKPQKINNFVATHITAIEGACRIASTTSNGLNMDSHETEIDKAAEQSVVEDLNQFEDWRGLGTAARKPAKYLSGFPGAELAVAAASFKPRGVLQNGTGQTVTVDDTTYVIKNTCCFDALCHVVSNAYLNFESYRNHVGESRNDFMLASMMLAKEGPTKGTYAKRAESLTSVLEPQGVLQMPTTRRRTLALEYDAFGNPGTLLKKMIPPHKSREVVCEVESHKSDSYLVDPDSRVLLTQGFKGLKESLTSGKCTKCVSSYGGHIFVDVEFVCDDSFPRGDDDTPANLVALDSIPRELPLGNESYRLAGVVSYLNHHYVAYCYSSRWFKYDDLQTKERGADASTKIWPSILMYVK